MPYVVELDGTYVIGDRNRLQAADGLRHMKGDYHLFTDLQGAISKTVAVESDIRYAELMVSRKLQEDGEFEEPVFVISHWKKKRGKTVTDLCFTALPSRRYFQYLDQVSRHDAHLVVSPLQSVLRHVLQKRARNKPAAVVFQHDRFADLMVGTRQRVWFAGRAVAYDNSDEQIQTLWNTIDEDIRRVADDYSQPVDTLYVVTWINSKLPDTRSQRDYAVIILDTDIVEWEDRTYQVSLPRLIRAGGACPVLAPAREKIFHGARRLLPYMNVLCLLAALACMLAGGWYRYHGHRLQKQIGQVRAQAALIRSNTLAPSEAGDYAATLKHIEEIRASRLLPTYSQVLRDFDVGPDSGLRLKNLKADYGNAKVDVDAFGTISEPFDTAYKAYQYLLYQLKRRGYRVVEEHFDTRISSSHFTLQAVKEVQ